MRSRPILPLFFTVFLDMVGLGIAIPTLALILFDANTSVLPLDTTFAVRAQLYGFLVATFPVFQFFGSPIWGGLSDRLGRKPMLIFALCGTMIGYVLFALGVMMGSIELLFISRAIDGFAGGSISIAMSSIADISGDERSKARNFGLVGMAFGMGFILGPFLGGKLADPTVIPWFNQSIPFWFAAMLACVNILLFLLMFTETLKTKKRTSISPLTGFRNIGKAFKYGNLRTMFLVVFLLTLGFNFFTQTFQVFLVEKFNFKEGNIGDLFAYVGIWIAIAQGLILRPLSRKFKPGKILSYSMLCLAITLPILVIPNSAIWLFVILPFIAIFQGLTEPNSTAIVSDLAGPDSQGEILGIKQSIQALGQAIPPLVSAFILTTHITTPIYAAGAMTILAWLVFIIGFKPKHEEVFRQE